MKQPTQDRAAREPTPANKSQNAASPRAELQLALPDPRLALEQDEEFFLVRRSKGWLEVRMHDYPTIFSIPGLYEKVVYGLFECRSPQVVRDLVERAWTARGIDPNRAKVLDLGCGNGCVAEALATLGAKDFVGVDLHPEAEAAAKRDRPGLYGEFVIGDLCNLPPETERRWGRIEADLLTCVAALGFSDIPPAVFERALERVSPGGLVAFTLKRDFTTESDESGFAGLLNRLVRSGALDVVERRTYVHRRSTSGEAIEYVAFLAAKR
ncbi:MAG: methyltransferase domain-containing protein [Planctomycetaceae bacterium]|nr:methyltransferase domain-containing protein [Planctomycetaceae bacterium]